MKRPLLVSLSQPCRLDIRFPAFLLLFLSSLWFRDYPNIQPFEFISGTHSSQEIWRIKDIEENEEPLGVYGFDIIQLDYIHKHASLIFVESKKGKAREERKKETKNA